VTAGEALKPREQRIDLPLEAKRTLLFRPAVWMVLAALAVRLAVVAFVYNDWLDPARDHYYFGYENGRVARSIASGQGVSNPLHGESGPTALIMPVYPLILAGVFKIFGIYSKAAAIAILSLNSLFSALTCLPIVLISRRLGGQRTSMIAGWMWAFWPNGIYFSADWMWPTCLTTLLLAFLFLIAIHLQTTKSKWVWAGFGLLTGFAALNDPNVLSVLPLLTLWVCLVLHRRSQPWLRRAVLAAAAAIVVVVPWLIRDYRTFHQFIPFRDGLGLELYVGNNGYSRHWANGKVRPSNNPAELTEFKQGEIAYVEHKKEQALGFIEAHPGWYAVMTLRRAIYLWTGFWSLERSYLAEEPMDPANILLSLAALTVALIGMRRLWRQDRAQVVPFLLVMAFFPLTYCLTHPEVYYMRPIDPLIVVLAAYGITPRHHLRTNGARTMAAV
jgi:4-amino-4-deoxy-L-arabinose transferase-like glycosyltransferase